jgi:hypothetical protein
VQGTVYLLQKGVDPCQHLENGRLAPEKVFSITFTSSDAVKIQIT